MEPTVLAASGSGIERAGWNLRAKVLGRWWDRTSALSTRLARCLFCGRVVGSFSRRMWGFDEGVPAKGAGGELKRSGVPQRTNSVRIPIAVGGKPGGDRERSGQLTV